MNGTFDLISGETSRGLYWSTTSYDNWAAYNLRFAVNMVMVADGHPNNYGLSVRCVYGGTMQTASVLDFTEGEEKTLIDARDGNRYTVKKINGDLWMTQNLRFMGTTLDPDSSNVQSSKTLTYYSLDSNDASYANHCDDVNGFNYACTKDSNSLTTGVWYNYAAASAETVKTDDNGLLSLEDICPQGWHLPTGPVYTNGTDFNKLVGNTTTGWNDPTSGLIAFNVVTGGRYYNGSILESFNASWWSSSYGGPQDRPSLLYNGDMNKFQGGYHSTQRYVGIYIRCVHD